MLIKSLSLKNFQCYCGELDQNHFCFKNGLNLIIGNNGNGKSKVFDGFYWVLYDQIFDTDIRQFTPTSVYGEKLISDKVTRNCEVGDTATAEACLVVESSQGREYRLTRVFHCTKLSDTEWMKERSILLIEEKKTNRWTTSNETPDSVLNRVIPPHIKPYMWFQGEQVDGLMDLTQKSSLAKIIKLLSDINFYDELVEITHKGAEKSSKSLLKNQKSLSKNKEESDRLEKEFNDNLREIKNLEDDKKLANENYTNAQSKINDLLNKIDDAEEKQKLKIERANLEIKLKANEDSVIEKRKSFTSKMFHDYWILKFSKPSLEKFGRKYKEYFEKHQQIVNQNQQTSFKLPLNVPQPMHLHGMLESETCYVCNRKAEKGSDAYQHIEELVNRSSSVTKSPFECDCSEYYDHLYTKSIRFYQHIETTNERISEQFDTISSLEADILENKSRLDTINAELEGLLENDSSEDVVSEFRRAQSNVERFGAEQKDIENKLNRLSTNQEKIKKSLEKLTLGKVDLALVNAEKVFASLARIAKSTREEVYTQIVLELESKANKIFEEMTSSNMSFKGRIRLKRLDNGAYKAEIVDQEGYSVTGSNDSNIVLVKLALIMAILTARARWSDNFTLISDAPTSKMAHECSTGFYKALSSNFSQSIVMTYDFIEPEDRAKFIMENKQNIGSIHILNSKYASGNMNDRTDLETSIEEVVL